MSDTEGHFRFAGCGAGRRKGLLKAAISGLPCRGVGCRSGWKGQIPRAFVYFGLMCGTDMYCVQTPPPPPTREELWLCGLWNLTGEESWGGLKSFCVNCGRCLAVPSDFRDSVLEQRGQTVMMTPQHSGSFTDLRYLFSMPPLC